MFIAGADSECTAFDGDYQFVDAAVGAVCQHYSSHTQRRNAVQPSTACYRLMLYMTMDAEEVVNRMKVQEAQLSPRHRAMRRVNGNLANCHATVQKLLIRQVLTKSMV